MSACHESAGGGHWRSACSRAYYAAHNASHAIICHLDPEAIPPRGNFSHGELPGRLRRTLIASGLRMAGQQVELLRVGMRRAYRVRIQADYKPKPEVGPELFGGARRDAQRVLHVARRLMK